MLETTAYGIATLLVPVIAMADEAHERARTAEHLNGRLLKMLAKAHENWPATSWGAANETYDELGALLAELGESGTMGPTDPEETA